MPEDQVFVIVGAGLTGAKAAETLRAEGFDGRIVLVGDESERPYERPPLSKGFLQGKEPKEKAYVHEAGWYEENRVELLLGTRAMRLDPLAHRLILDNGEDVQYTKLLIATGAEPRPLAVAGTELAGVYYLRRFPDSGRLKDVLSEGARVLIVGAGWIGLEVAAAARLAGAQVTVVELGSCRCAACWGTRWPPSSPNCTVSTASTYGCRPVCTSSGARGKVESALLSDGRELPVDAVIVGIGIAPADDLAELAGIKLENGILVDEHLRTSVPDVYAAGDVANAENTLLGRRIRVEHWANALNAGPLAARSMLDQDVAYDRVPYFFTDQYDLGMEYSGFVANTADGPGYDRVVFRGDVAAREFIVFWLKDGRVLAGMNVNVWDVTGPIQDLVRAGYAGKSVDLAKLANPDVPLDDLLG